MKELLLSDRWRPKTFDDVILLPRIREVFKNGITRNVLLYGSWGTGKTTLARILIGLYAKNRPCLPINSSYYTSIETLRTKIDDFCSKVYMGFDLDSDVTMDTTKYVFLDEFERTSIQYQDALKAYIDEFSTKNVRFIFNTNHINKVSPGILSRLMQVNFDCQSPEEEKYLKTEIYKRITNVIAPKEEISIKKEDLIKVINKKFPDFRAMMDEIQTFKETGSFSISNTNINIKLRNELYSYVFESKSYEETYHFLMNNFGPEKIDEVITLFGRPFIEYSLNDDRSNIDKLFKVGYVITEHTKLLDTNTDPIILGMTVIDKRYIYLIYNFMPDFTDFYIIYKDDPSYIDGELIEDEIVNVIVQKYKMVLFTNKGEVLGDPDFGANLLELLYETKVSESYVTSIIDGQINLYIPELANTNYTLNVIFVQDPENYQDIMFVNLKFADYDIYAQIGKTI